jgi:outer membrane protein W
MKYILSILVAMLISSATYSQAIYSLNYTMSLGVGDQADYINAASFRGFTFDGRGFISDQVSMGGVFTWSTFYEKLGGVTVTDGTTTLTGNQYRYINAFPMLLTAHYYTNNDPYSTRAYLGTGLGAYKITKRTNVGVWSVEDAYWHFGIAPEVGILIPINMDTKFNIGLKYHYAFKTKESINYSWFGLNLGFAWGD